MFLSLVAQSSARIGSLNRHGRRDNRQHRPRIERRLLRTGGTGSSTGIVGGQLRVGLVDEQQHRERGDVEAGRRRRDGAVAQRGIGKRRANA